ncbi:related to FEN1 - fatty acid elongase [Cephalotrichum gorgonifer]|uniref:Elongation of fatty acids protein n=1 Tax=Cephalotrichum gorgonifer TaxID=2041049 RepID=A0AAE8SVR6_9PEZI|nr:related to FEN1 - fatty acid elongase [Cephalotrichum gorgonifer]
MASAATPVVLASLPEQSLFSFPPVNIPFAQPAPASDNTDLAWPPLFTIPSDIFNAVLDPKVPITIAAVYAVTVKLLNRYNRANNKKPWAISKTRAFSVFVILHNVFLAVYSAWTCLGMFRTLKAIVPSYSGPDGLAGVADSLCQMSGAPGLGEAVFFDQGTGAWTSLSAQPALTAEGLTSPATPGRMWNEGLAFYGWIFYLSKFYEVLDTLIILAKGKPSSTLQTYHHAGAMMAMWAGIRYMAAPIWVFVLVNSGIHAMMYTYYTVTAFRIKVPVAIKRTLTTLQITQFVFGGSYAMIHSFVSYTIPVTVAVAVAESAPAPEDVPTSSTASAVEAAASGLLGGIKSLVLGAADQAADASASAFAGAAEAGFHTETTFVTQQCVTTDGATFAIWLNVLYLAPLTYLFARFFVTSYLRRGKAVTAKRRMSSIEIAEKAGWDAARGVEREVYGAVSEDAIEEEMHSPKVNGKANGKANGKVNGKTKSR